MGALKIVPNQFLPLHLPHLTLSPPNTQVKLQTVSQIIMSAPPLLKSFVCVLNHLHCSGYTSPLVVSAMYQALFCL